MRLLLGAAGRDHDPVVLLRDDRGSCDQAGRIRAEQELRLVLYDDARVELLDAGILRLVVVGDEIDLVLLAADLDAAGGIDLVAPQLEAAHLRGRVVVELAALRGRESDGERILGERRGGAYQHGCNRQSG